MIEMVSNFKSRFNQALKIRNIKPVELSEKTGISESTLSQYRSGYAKPKDEKLVILSNALNVNPVWLMGMNVPMEENPTSIHTESIDIANQYESLSPEQKEHVRNYIKFLKSDS